MTPKEFLDNFYKHFGVYQKVDDNQEYIICCNQCCQSIFVLYVYDETKIKGIWIPTNKDSICEHCKDMFEYKEEYKSYNTPENDFLISSWYLCHIDSPDAIVTIHPSKECANGVNFIIESTEKDV